MTFLPQPLRHLLVTLLFAGVCSGAFAQSYGNAPTLYNWVSSTGHTEVEWTGAPGGPTPACTGGSSVIDDDITAELPIGFSFNFGGTGYSTVRIMSNGRLQFNNSYCYYGTQTVGPPPTYTVPYPNNNLDRTIRVYGADLCPAGGGTGCAGTVTYTTQGTAPNRSFVVTWNNVREWNSGSSLFNLQVILYENGEFVFQYKDVSNVSSGAGQIGYQLSTSDYGLYDTAGVSSMAYSAIRFFLPPATWGEYRFDECSGTTVTDSSGNNYNATLTNGAMPGSSGALCKGVLFDGTNDYVLLPANFPHINSSFTITAWIYTTHNWQTGGQKDMRIVVDDQNNSGGYAFSLGDGGWDYDSGGVPAGRLRFYNRSLNPVIFDSPPVIRSNTWYFVAAVTDFAANQRFISVFDAAGNLLSETAQVSTGAWGTDTGRISIGGELDGTAEGVAQWRFKGFIDEVKLFKSPLTARQMSGMALNEGGGYGYNGYQRLCVPCTTQIGRFNVFESSTASGAINGVIKTKIAGSNFSSSSGSLRVVAVNSGGNAIQNINPTVSLSLLDASDDTQPLDTEACRNSWTTIQSLPSVNLSSGIGTLNTSIPNAYPNVRLRVDRSNGDYGCSTDNFAIRPNSLAIEASDSNWQTAGSTRTPLNNTSTTGGIVHGAGYPMTLTATARNAANSLVAGYSGTPSFLPGYLILPNPTACPACSIGSFNPGSWTAASPSGTIVSNTASYADVGSFGFSLQDQVYAKVDQGDSSKAERYIGSNVAELGRFVPASYALQLNAPTLRTFGNTCATRSFTYLGQPFGFAVTPLATVSGQKVGGGVTANFRSTGGLWSLQTPLVHSATTTCTAPTQTCVTRRQDSNAKTRLTTTYSYTSSATTPGWDGTVGSKLIAGDTTLASADDGSGLLSFSSTDRITLYRNPTGPATPFTANVAMALQLDDFSEAGDPSTPITGNPAQISGTLAATALTFDAGNSFRYGRAQLTGKQGNPALDLDIPFETQYWNGTAFITNSDDQCTPLAASDFILANFSPAGISSSFTTPSPHVTVGAMPVNGIATVKVLKPNPAIAGSFTLCLDAGLGPCSGTTAGALDFLTVANPSNSSRYENDPSASVIFGSRTSPIIYMRERY